MLDAVSLRTPKYRHHKAKNLAVVTIAGRDIYLGKYDSAASKAEYRRLVGEYIQTGATAPAAAVQISVIEVVAAYIKFASGYYRKGGKATREYGLIVECCRFIKPLYGRSSAADFGPLALKAVRQKMIEADHSRKFINKNIDRIRRMFRWAAENELIPADIPRALAMVVGLRKGRSAARETEPIKPVEDSIVEATIRRLPQVVADMVRLQRLTGARPSEICDIRPGDINRQGDAWEYTPASHKTEHHDRQRVIFIGAKGQRILLPYLLRAADAYCFSPREAESKRRAAQHEARRVPLSCGNRPGTNRKMKPRRMAGEKYNKDSYARAVRRAAVKAKVNTWSPNRLRHSFATEVRKSFGLEAVQVCLGHAAARVSEIYAERDFAKAANVARQIG